MQCLVDEKTLTMAERNGVEIDFCPKCRGDWLDLGELDKIIERTAPSSHASVTTAAPDSYASRPQKKKRESVLGDLFNF